MFERVELTRDALVDDTCVIVCDPVVVVFVVAADVGPYGGTGTVHVNSM